MKPFILRDLKPNNVMVNYAKNKVYCIDFGCALSFKDEEELFENKHRI